jgi:hypothetical protein
MDAASWGALATGAGSLVSAGALVFIWRQTRATREAAEATTAQAEIAAKALAVAERDHAQSQFLAIEAVKARIDSQMPRVLLSVENRVTWPPLEPSAFYLGAPQPHASAEPFRMPRDANKRLILRVYLSLTNESDTTVDIRLSRALYRDDEQEQRVALPLEIQLASRQSAGEVYLDVERSVAEWVAIYDERDRTGGGGQEYEFIATYISPLDTGAIDRHRVLIGGTVLEPVSDQVGAWQLIGKPNPSVLTGAIGSVGWHTLPTTRNYYLSRAMDMQLPDVAAVVGEASGSLD